MVITTAIPALLVVWFGTSLHIQFLQWLGVPSGVCTGVFLAWLFGRIAYKKLERNGPELLFEMKRGIKIKGDNHNKKAHNKATELPKKKLAVVVLFVFMGIFF